jgi:hypothetical protein
MQSKIMKRGFFDYSDYLGWFNPYYLEYSNNEVYFENNYTKIVALLNSSRSIDPVAVSEILSKKYMLGDRTILRKINRTPWMARYDMNLKKWILLDLPKHLERHENNEFIANELFKLLCEEVKKYIGDAKKVGILLSGGMDSRIVAGIIDYLKATRQIEIDNVIAYTWGNPGCRDVIYAKAIAQRLGWEWTHYSVKPSDLWENFMIAGFRGCEYSGIHLHAIPQIAKDVLVDTILAGSYGDSIGRAEYQGVHIDRLTPVNYGFRNFGNLLRFKAYNEIKGLWLKDIEQYHARCQDVKSFQKNEVDYQLHYMRRMLNPCLELINEVVPTFQVFTSPAVYQFMWSLNAECRTDSVYMHMMKLFKTSLDDIPWARTGLPYGTLHGLPDTFSKNHHSYSTYIQNELLDEIESRVSSGRIRGLNLFNMDTINSLIKMIRTFPNNNADYLERITWLVSLDFFLEKFENVKCEGYSRSSIDFVAAYFLTPLKYVLLQMYRSSGSKFYRK